MLKGSVFGEFSYEQNVFVFCIILYATNIIVAFSVFILGIYYIIKSIILKKFDYFVLLTLPFAVFFTYAIYESDTLLGYVCAIPISIFAIVDIFYIFANIKMFHKKHLALIFFELIFLTFLFSFFSFQLTYPYTCTHDFRYIGLFLICFGFVIGYLMEKRGTNKNFTSIIFAVLAIYSFASFGLYASL